MLFKVAITNVQDSADTVFDRFYVKADAIQEVFTKVEKHIRGIGSEPEHLNPKEFRVTSIQELNDDLVE